ncbi:methylisocitrate lyase, partial [Acinetobacter defluvii]
RENGTQVNVLDTMQQRKELYEFLDYHAFENTLDKLFTEGK